jgi:hypothetical protein
MKGEEGRDKKGKAPVEAQKDSREHKNCSWKG